MLPLIFPDNLTETAGIAMPSKARPAGYAALIAAFKLAVPPPDEMLAIGDTHTLRREGRWRVLTPRYRPMETAQAHVEFALKHEGVDLGVLNALFHAAPPDFIKDWVRSEPSSQYARRAWFLYEWLTNLHLDLPDTPKMPYANVLDEDRQYAVRGETVLRYRIRNNLPGTPEFCPLIRRSESLTSILASDLANEARAVVNKTAPDLMARAAAFLLLQDSKASYVIEGEKPPHTRIQRWGQAIKEAGQRRLTPEELLRLQRIVIGDDRFTHLGWRTEGGFVGTHDRWSKAPLPDHISAKAEDLPRLISGLLTFVQRSEDKGLEPVIAAAAAAFGFVFIHPFEDGNGRLHRWLVHHVLARRGFSPSGVVFPVSAVFLEHIHRYHEVLQHYSLPRLSLTQWETTPSFNVRVVNETRDFFRFFDATRQAEFLGKSVLETVRVVLPRELDYLRRYDQAKHHIDTFLDLPDSKFDLLMVFLRQNGGRLSERARTHEFKLLNDKEAAAVESTYQDLLSEFDQPISNSLNAHERPPHSQMHDSG